MIVPGREAGLKVSATLPIKGEGRPGPALVVLLTVLGFAVTGAGIWTQQMWAQQIGGSQIQLNGAATPAIGAEDRSVQTDAAHRSHVSLVSDALQVQAGTPQVVEVVFRVDPGFHINSHKPKDGLLIPTVFHLEANATKLLDESYPAGSDFRLSLPGSAGGGETLDVYQGEFRVALRVVVPKGNSTLTGALHYQACDNAACFPPRTLPVKVMLTGR